MSFKAVIGANYGDEGKGLLTDYFAAKSSKICIVARFNGGAQAGHTVQTPKGQRHVFSHFGSGSFTTPHTYLTKQFIVNITAFNIEYANLKNFNIPIHLFVHKDCLVTLPIDVGFNQTLETKRGMHRHGSCGLGVSETIERSSREHLRLTVNDCQHSDRLEIILHRIKKEWIPQRSSNLHIDPKLMTLQAEAMMEEWFEILSTFLNTAKIVDNNDMLYSKDIDVIFEGAQRLALDQALYSHSNPYVTRSNCGIQNVCEILSELPDPNIDVTYVSRCYITRHGAGPLPNEETMPSWVNDPTNIPNDWQGSLRYAPFNPQDVNARILNDISKAKHSNIGVSFNTAITCLDQVPDEQFNFAQITNHKYSSFGPTRQNVMSLG